MAGSLLDFGEIAQRAQQQVRDAVGMQNMQTHQNQVENERVRLQQEDRRMTQQSVFRGFDEIEKLMKAPQFSTPERQLGLRVTQANLLKNGLGLKDMDLPSEEELRGGMKQFAENLRLFRHGATLPERQAAFERLALSMPDYGLKILEAQKEAGELDTQGEELRLKLDTKKAELKAMNLKYSRASIQQGMFSEHLGAMAQPLQLLDSPEFQPHVKKLQEMNDLARQAYLKSNPAFAKSFERAMKPHLEMYGAVGPEFESVLGDDVQPRMLTALDDAITNKRKSRQEVFDRDGEIPLELDEELSGMELVRKARKHQYAWMRDPFNTDKLNAMKKAQQDMKIAADVAGKTMGGVEDARTALAQTKFTAEQQEKKAEDYAQDRKLFYLNSGHNETKAAFLASQDTRKEFPETSYGAEKLQPKRPLVENKTVFAQETAESQKVGGGFGEQFDAYQKDGRSALRQTDTLRTMQNLLKTIDTGAGVPTMTKIQNMAKTLGFEVDKSLGPKQAFSALANEMVLRARNPESGGGLTGNTSNKDLDFLIETVPGLDRSNEGNALIVETGLRLAKRNLDLARMAGEYRRKNGHFDDGFLQVAQKFIDGNPLFDDLREKAAKLTPQPGKAQPQGGAVLKALPKGSKQIGTSGGKPVYQDATGKKWIGE